MESLEIFLSNSDRSYSDTEKIELAAEKNNYYLKLLEGLDKHSILPGVIDAINEFRRRSLKVGIGSSSKNCQLILNKIGLANAFDACIDGTHVENGKPHPEIFLKAAQDLGVPPRNCLVIEDGDPGVQAAHAAGMLVLGVGPASQNKDAHFNGIDLSVVSFDEIFCYTRDSE